MLGKVVFYKHPGASTLGARNAAGAGGLAERFGMHVQEGGRFVKAQGFHMQTSRTRRAAGNRKPHRPVTGRRYAEQERTFKFTSWGWR
jgi:hypothetical protein